MTLAIFACGYAVLWVTGVTSTGDLLGDLIVGYLLAWGLCIGVGSPARRDPYEIYLYDAGRFIHAGNG